MNKLVEIVMRSHRQDTDLTDTERAVLKEKLCINCKYFCRYDQTCKAFITDYDLVMGYNTNPSCKTERMELGRCKPQGIFFEESNWWVRRLNNRVETSDII